MHNDTTDTGAEVSELDARSRGDDVAAGRISNGLPATFLSDGEREFLLEMESHPAIVGDQPTVDLVHRALRAEAVRIARVAAG